MFRALLALGLTAQAHAMSCATGGISIDNHVCTGNIDASIVSNSYRCKAKDVATSSSFSNGGCPTGWRFYSDGMHFECVLTVPSGLEDNPVADCSVNMCPDGYVPHEGTCVDSCPDGYVVGENSCSPCPDGYGAHNGACVGPMGFVRTAEGWVPHTCTTISESYINSQCCQGC